MRRYKEYYPITDEMERRHFISENRNWIEAYINIMEREAIKANDKKVIFRIKEIKKELYTNKWASLTMEDINYLLKKSNIDYWRALIGIVIVIILIKIVLTI